MDLPSVESAVIALVKRGYLANIGNPGKVMPHLKKPLIAVNLDEASFDSRTMVAYVCGPKNMGQVACETVAARVAAVWAAEGAEVRWGYYSFDGKSAMHIAKAYGTWHKVEETTSE